jgi:hypothetical protein
VTGRDDIATECIYMDTATPGGHSGIIAAVTKAEEYHHIIIIDIMIIIVTAASAAGAKWTNQCVCLL